MLTAPEMKLLAALRPHLLETPVAFCAGRGRPRKRGQTLTGTTRGATQGAATPHSAEAS